MGRFVMPRPAACTRAGPENALLQIVTVGMPFAFQLNAISHADGSGRSSIAVTLHHGSALDEFPQFAIAQFVLRREFADFHAELNAVLVLQHRLQRFDEQIRILLAVVDKSDYRVLQYAGRRCPP